MISTTAVIIGGGVTGLSTAYHLARKGYGRIIVLEKGPVGDGSSSRAAGIITGLLWSETGVRARKLSLELFRELSEDLDGYSFQAVGCLNLFDLSSWPERAALLPLYERAMHPSRLWVPLRCGHVGRIFIRKTSILGSTILLVVLASPMTIYQHWQGSVANWESRSVNISTSRTSWCVVVAWQV